MDYKKQLYGYIEYEVSPEEGTNIVYFPEGIEVVSREILCDMLKDEKGILHEETVREVVLPDSVRVICDNAFRGFKNLWSVCLNKGGSDLHYIGKYAFAECENLIDVYCLAAEVPTTEENVFNNSYPEYMILHVPAEAVDSYKSTSPWKNFGNIVELNNTYELNVTSAGYATLYLDYAVEIPEGVEVYIAKAVENEDYGYHIKTIRDRDKAEEFLYGYISNLYKATDRKILDELGIDKVDGVMADLGVSSYQLDNEERGFSYMADAELDMRMDRRRELTAEIVVNTYSEEELARILFTYGEEKFSRKIAANIVKARQNSPIKTTGELVEIIKASMPAAAKSGGHHPAKRSFQAIRIEVNSEISIIEPAIKDLASLLNVGGRLSFITFHSLEDRIVKNAFKKYSTGCTCPDSFPVCVCSGKPRGVLVARKAIVADMDEAEANPRSKCAKLRCIEKI